MSYTVYRIQDADGRGPWKPGFSKYWVKEREDHNNLIPWFQEFGPVHQTKALVGLHTGCGCRTQDQLRRWFLPEEYAVLRAAGYAAVRINVDMILAESEIQCVFQRASPLNLDASPFELYAEETQS